MQILFMLLIFMFPATEGVCNFPSAWYQATPIWQDSSSGAVLIFDNYLRGWHYELYGTNITTWNCYKLQNDVLIVRSQSTVTYNSMDFSAFMCLAIATVNSTLAYYYHLTGTTDHVYTASQNEADLCDVCTTGINGNIRIISSLGDPSSFLSSLSSSNTLTQSFDLTTYCQATTTPSTGSVQSMRTMTVIVLVYFTIYVYAALC